MLNFVATRRLADKIGKINIKNMGIENNAPSAPVKKSHTTRNVIAVVVIVFCLWLFFASASFFLSPGALTMMMDEISGGKMGQIMSNIGLPGANVPTSENYLVKQKSSAPFSISGPKGVIDAKTNINFITVGFPMAKAQSGKYGWQTDWKVIVDSSYQLGTKTQIKDPASGLHTSAMTTNFSPSSMQAVYYFSLANVKEGDTFQVRYVQKNIKDATFHFNESQWIFYDDKNQPVHVVNFDTGERSAATEAPPADAKTLDAILLKDNGADGVIVSFKPVEFTKEQKAQLDSINQVVQGKGELSQWWNSQLYPMFSNLPQQPPLRIVLKLGLPESGYFDEKITNSEYWNAAPGVNVKNNDNNKLPDIAPLPSQNDLNGDGIPDLAPLPSQNDLNGDGIPDLVPLPGAKK
jgi:hypothetical protein